MKTWAEMTERERDVLVCQTLGYIPVKLNWWLNPNKDFNCDPESAFEWTREGVGRYAGHGVKYEGSDDRFKGKKFLKPLVTSRFSTDSAAAMSLLDGFNDWIIQKFPYVSGNIGHSCAIQVDGLDEEKVDFVKNGKDYVEFGTYDLPTSICIAFLKAKGVDVVVDVE